MRNFFGTHGSIPVSKSEMPVFITGTMRSGTTFLVDKITSHPQLLKTPGELNNVWTELADANCEDNCIARRAEDVSPEYTYQMTQYFNQCIEVSKSLKRHLMRAAYYFNHKRGRIRYDWDNVIVVNKSPHLCNKIDFVHGAFPQSKLIFIYRDIFQQSASQKAHFRKRFKNNNEVYCFPKKESSCWSQLNVAQAQNVEAERRWPNNFKYIPQMWMRLNKMAFDSLKRIDRDQFMVIDYDDLVQDQETVLKAVFDFLDLDPKHQAAADKIATVKISSNNSNIKGNPLHKWKKSLQKEEIGLIEQCIEDHSTIYHSILGDLDSLKFKIEHEPKAQYQTV
ncbi:sulfotransferase [bacterium]|nr:sulfotransferase [bacterium]